LADRNGMPFGKWQDRYIDWFRDLGFLQKSGMETKATRDIAAFLSQPPRGIERRSASGQTTK
jgi:endo-1,4-beta-xylanase